MLSLVKKFYAPLLIGIFVLVAGVSSYVVYTSPYTGMVFELCGDMACVDKVDSGSPAQRAGIKAGDLVMDVAGKGIGNLAFRYSPEHISKKDVPLFWEYQKRLNEIVVKGRLIELAIDRGGDRISVSIVPSSMPLQVFLRITLPFFALLASFVFITYLILRKMTSDLTLALFLCAIFAGIGDFSNCGFSFRSIITPFIPFKIFFFINIIGMILFNLTFLHFALIFPKKKQVLEEYPWIIKGIYLTGIPIALVTFFNYTFSFYFTVFAKIPALLLLLHTYLTEKNILCRRQMQWVVFGFSAIFFFRLSTFYIPILITGTPVISPDNPVFYIFAFMMPLSLIIAVTRYRLFEIEELFDYSVIYVSTMIVLFGIELVFLRYVSPLFFKDLMTSPSLNIMPAVLLIVFIYIPIRNAIKKVVQKIFRRHNYSFQEELNRFVLTAGLCSEAPVLDRFKKFVNHLLGPSDITIIKMPPPREGGGVIENINAISTYLKTTRTSVFGYQLIDAGVFNNPAFNTSLFIPVTAGEIVTHVIILHDKVSGKVYSRKDRHLLNAIAVNISHILEAEEIRRAKEEMALVHKRDRDYVMKEMHDGLGSLLTNIAFTSHHANRVISEDIEKAKESITLISTYSTTASGFLRTGLTVLNSHEGGEGEMGVIISNIRHRLAAEIEQFGMTVGFDMDKDTERLKVGSRISLNILRSVQEAFCNILKHSGADNVAVRINRDRGFVNIEIKDNGKGFDPNQHNANHETGRGFGLKNIRNRAEELGGYMKIQSSPGMGTTLMMSFPVEEKG